jgi:Yip1 domain
MTTTTRNISASFSTFIYRVVGATLLDGSVYEDVEADRRAALQATAVVLLASLAPVVGFSGIVGFQSDALLRVAALSIVTWVAWAVLTFQIGTRLFPEPQTRTSLGELLRTTGFAAAPGLLQVFAVLPGMMMPVFVGTWIWMIAAMVVGVKHALDYTSTRRALLVCLTAAGLAGAMAMIFGAFFGPTVR